MKRLIAILALLLSACTERISPAPQAGDTYSVEFVWRVVDKNEMARAFKNAGQEMNEGDLLRGFTGHLPDGRQVVYTLPPRHLDDQAVCTLGHEILHITHGDYHR